METWQSLFVSLCLVIAFIAGTYVAYENGKLDPIIEKFGAMMFKAKAAAEKKKMEAEGKKEGEDFLDSQLKGNQQAESVLEGTGSLGKLKKQL